MTDGNELFKSIDRRLKMLVTIEAKQCIRELDTNKEKIRELHELGFHTSEIADLVDTTPASVRAAKSSLREAGEIDE